MVRVRVLFLLPLFAHIGLLAGCGGSNPPNGQANADPAAAGKDDPTANVGQPLYTAAPAPKLPEVVYRGNEPLVIANCTVQYSERQQVAAEVDGRIELLATPLEEEKADDKPTGRYILARKPDGAIEYYDPAKTYPHILFHPRDHRNPRVPYRRLSEGDEVKVDQVVGFLDDQLIDAKIQAAVAIKETVTDLRAQAEKGVKFTEQKLTLMKRLLDQNSGSLTDYLNDQITLSRFMENLAQAAQTLVKAEADHKEALVMLRKHRVTSNVNGIVRTIVKRPGEFVKAGDKILEVQATDKVRVEGNVEHQYAPLIQREMTVFVEPALPSAPHKSHNLHRQEVNGVAVTAHPGRPLVVSVSADGSALIWDPNLVGAADRRLIPHTLPHPVPVRSVACSPAGKAVLAVTGGDDGKVRVWDLTNPDKLPGNPVREPAEAHAAAVQAVAFSPDGRFFATAGGKDVFVWDAAEGRRLYTLPAVHRDTITTLHFTPQCTLVTAARDRTIKVWRLGQERAAVAHTIDHRSGTVDVLGISRDGGRVLFDQDKSRIDLVSLADKQTVGQIQNAGSTASFATLALFSPSDQFLITAGGDGDLKGVLQVWTAPPTGGRGSEIARLITPGRVGVTCAAFSPSPDGTFLVVGTEKGGVHVWTPPSEARAKTTGRLTNWDPTDPRYATIRVEVNNEVLKLPDRSTATIIISPAQ